MGQGILTSNCGIMNFHPETSFQYFVSTRAQEQFIIRSKVLAIRASNTDNNAEQCLFWHWVTEHPGTLVAPLHHPTHIGVSQRVKTTPSSRQYTGCCRTHAKADLSFSVVSSGATGVGLRQGLRTAWKMLSRDQTWSLALGRIMFPLLNVLQ